ncbi:MAG: DUF2378 family protein [Archangiaceae bacterium]|nr:DUF2378 family protein [Archangiaceae bacterium]
MARVPEVDPKVRHIAFEALFTHGVPADPPLKEALKKAGFDFDKPAGEYPLSVLGRCLEAAIAQRYLSLANRDALRTMGNRFIAGILSTMLGKVVGVAVLLSGPDRTVKRIPSLMKSDYGVSVEAQALGPRRYAVTSSFGYPLWAGPFFHGIFEEALRKTGVVPESSCKVDANTGSFVIDLAWPEKT